MNCLIYLLDLIEKDYKFIILSNENHYIGVSNDYIHELGNIFKKDLKLGYSLNGGNNYIPIITDGYARIVKSFKLDAHYSKLLNNYFKNIENNKL